MGGLNPVGVAVLVVALLGGFWAGSSLKQAQWDRAENKALELQAELRRQSDEELKVLNELNLALQVGLEESQRKAEQFNEELQNEINREPVTTTFTVTTSDECPVVQCNIPDARQHYRLFNCAINNACETLSDASDADIGNVRLSRSDFTAGLDGGSGPDN